MANPHTISEGLRDNFIHLIAQRTGIEIRTQNYSTMGDNILSRVKTLKLPNPQEYLHILSQSDEAADREWQNFVCLLTNRESYFFRDKGQMNLLRQRILPDIIRANQRTKTIRLCSAGCSTGQEPYSLAILLTELLPDIEEWQLKIVGIDINRESLQQGKKATYNPWSFRQVEDSIKEQYFRNLAGYYKLENKIQQLVKFHQVNLVLDPFHQSNPDTQNLDLIVCRNVFIYFTDQAIATVVDKFFDILKPNGYFMAGHAELQNHHIRSFKGHMFPESVVYTKQGHRVSPHQGPRFFPTVPKAFSPIPQPTSFTQAKPPAAQSKHVVRSPIEVKTKPKPLPAPVALAINPLPDELTVIRKLIEQKSFSLALKKLEIIYRQHPRDYQTCMLMAEVYADLGEHTQAKNWCDQAIELDSSQLSPYYLLAKIAEEKNDIELAKQILKRVVYLDDRAVPAYLYLASIYQSQGDSKRHQKLQKSAIKILEDMPPEDQLDELGSIKVEDLIKQLSPF